MEAVSIFYSVKMIGMFQVLIIFSTTLVITDTSVAVSLNDLNEMEAHCMFLDNCQERFGAADDLDTYTCDCSHICAEYNTCCVDSEFRNATTIPTPRTVDECLQVHGRTDLSVYMIDRCKNKNIPSEILCESNAEENNDPFLMIPITSSVTGKTYKNYFCAICNENTNEDLLFFWNLQLTGETECLQNSTVPDILYDTALKSWVLVEEDGSFTNVSIQIEPSNPDLIKKCKVVITTCPKEWEDASVKEKCEGNYMARIGFKDENGASVIWYKNPHCALCNFRNVSKHICDKYDAQDIMHIFDSTLFVKLFVLTDRSYKCGTKAVYDKFGNKCRCNSRESYLRNGKCVSRTRT